VNVKINIIVHALKSLDHKVELIILKTVSNIEVAELFGSLLVVECEARPLEGANCYNMAGIVSV
jgi:hypothetical protein